ncbi:hypothetical protein M406DRAFT_355647 [Cryphonectria parasitica EP155]|uniref:Uncharacterized protein n=1 Tax=Cryphonectria parasitica (strain ATCC 38755 / EP155) TaxID=660469 RepID=A0A9P4Y7S4_CRYP1|nr:uncharacterized protein M406DRAFT_355647 [Cryphonectria parasitica EP155]KAF3767655.1 hypothetical protein M406DRAFT_355647 [Cryphonectria parasitica EP155]
MERRMRDGSCAAYDDQCPALLCFPIFFAVSVTEVPSFGTGESVGWSRSQPGPSAAQCGAVRCGAVVVRSRAQSRAAQVERVWVQLGKQSDGVQVTDPNLTSFNGPCYQ